MTRPITVIKRNFQGEETWRYTGSLTRRAGTVLHLEAPFIGPETPFMGMFIKHGERYVEVYYTDRWYNIFEIYDRDDGALKGYYCNVTRPARFADGRVEYVDLFLDLWVSADGTQTVLDEDEFLAAELDESTRRMAREALMELQALFKTKRPPQ